MSFVQLNLIISGDLVQVPVLQNLTFTVPTAENLVSQRYVLENRIKNSGFLNSDGYLFLNFCQNSHNSDLVNSIFKPQSQNNSIKDFVLLLVRIPGIISSMKRVSNHRNSKYFLKYFHNLEISKVSVRIMQWNFILFDEIILFISILCTVTNFSRFGKCRRFSFETLLFII